MICFGTPGVTSRRMNRGANQPFVCSTLSDSEAASFHISPSDKQDFIEEVTTEISVYLGMLYHLVEVFKGYDDFADELSQCTH